MQQIINFLINKKNFILFLLLLFLSLFFTVQSNSYHKTKYINSANWISGSVYKKSDAISNYFHLKQYNKQLVEENHRLRTIIFNNSQTLKDSIVIDSSTLKNYKLHKASIINNSYSKLKNYLTLDIGANNSVKEDMGVVTSQGIVGIINNTSNNYSTVQSVLNTLSKINAKLKKTNHFGTLVWNGESPKTLQLIDIPGIAPVKVGDTITTGGMSTIFPKNILIGTVSSFSLDNSKNYYTLQVDLFNDMTNIDHVYIIENFNTNEILNLENSINE